ncbi:MAG: hypothetical protein F9K23_04555 [Bacteroidetes bacterium]|nr:MAG: hypothetical protein F9K23_04555 [Bacteroidota bacterium]
MKKHYLYYLLAIVAGVVSISSCKNKPAEQKVDDAATATKAPYTVTLEEVNSDFAPALQSFAWAQAGGELLILGGRTNGFHNFSGTSSVFTPKRRNTYFYVVDLDSSKTDSLSIPAAFLDRLSATNMEYYHEGNTLYCIGGYGVSGKGCDVDSPPASCYQTFPYLTAINVPAAITAIQNQNSAALASAITSSAADDRLRVTGGELHKIGNWYYLVFGQNFNTIYNPNSTGIYTNEVRRFQIDNSGTTPKITGYAADTCTWDDSSFHRRDLVVLESYDVNGNPNITVYGGVFTPQANIDYQTPIYISQADATTGATTITTDNNFLQQFNQYAAPNIAFYDAASKTTYTTILGGITQYYYDDKGNLVNSNNTQDPMPFSNYATTIVRTGSSTAVEYPQQSPTLPGYLGSEAIFVPHVSIVLSQGRQKTIDMAKLPKSTDSKGIMLGYMYGGIESKASQSTSDPNSTVSSKRIFKVYLKPNL